MLQALAALDDLESRRRGVAASVKYTAAVKVRPPRASLLYSNLAPSLVQNPLAFQDVSQSMAALRSAPPAMRAAAPAATGMLEAEGVRTPPAEAEASAFGGGARYHRR